MTWDIQPVSGTGPLIGSVLTSRPTVAATTTPTTTGDTAPVIAIGAGQVYRVRSYGVFTSANSATARTGSVQPFWGATGLQAHNGAPVLVSVARSFSFISEHMLIGVDTTHVWSSTLLLWTGRALNITEGLNGVGISTLVAAGPQTLDLRFFMSVVVAGDVWTVDSVTYERLA